MILALSHRARGFDIAMACDSPSDHPPCLCNGFDGCLPSQRWLREQCARCRASGGKGAEDLDSGVDAWMVLTMVSLEYGSDRFERRGRLLHWQSIGVLGDTILIIYQLLCRPFHTGRWISEKANGAPSKWVVCNTYFTRPALHRCPVCGRFQKGGARWWTSQ
jgi:hypothetical protein